MLSEEQAEAVKKQLIAHIEKSFPEERKAYAREQIEHMTSNELEEFLKNNNLVAGHSSQCIFCSIIFGDIPSHKIDENLDSVAVLEINPISKGHVLILPKTHGENTNMKEAEKLAKKVTQRIKTKLKPKRIDTVSSNTFGHNIMNLLPVYADETISSKRHAANKDELESVEKLLMAKPKSQRQKSRKPRAKKSVLKKVESAVEKGIKSFEKKLWLPQRIP